MWNHQFDIEVPNAFIFTFRSNDFTFRSNGFIVKPPVWLGVRNFGGVNKQLENTFLRITS